MQKIDFGFSVRAQGERIKYLLARMALTDPSRFWKTFAGDGGLDYLSALWSGLGDELPARQRVSPAGCSIDLLGEALVLRFPTPRLRGEPYALAFKTNGDCARVFLLERADAAVLHLGVAMVIEISHTGRHALGPVADTTTATFVTHIPHTLASARRSS